MSDAQHELSTFIAAVRRRWQVCAMSRTLAAGVLSAAVPLAGALLLDRLSHPHGIALILLAAASILLASGLVGLTLWRMPRRPDDQPGGPLHRGARGGSRRARRRDRYGGVGGRNGRRVRGAPGAGAAVAKLRGLTSVGDRAGHGPAARAVGRRRRRARRWSIGGAAAPRCSGRRRRRRGSPGVPQSLQIEVLPGDARVPARPAASDSEPSSGCAAASSTRVSPTLLVVVRRGSPRSADDRRRRRLRLPHRVGRPHLYTTGSRRAADVARLHGVGAVRAQGRTASTRITNIRPSPASRRATRRTAATSTRPAGTRVRLRVHTDRPVRRGE